MRLPSCLAVLVFLALAAVAFVISPADAQDPAHPEVAGWTDGAAAVGTARMLEANDPVAVALPPALAARITGPTALFYFSPSCPHCQHVMPEVNALAAYDDLAWLGVATSRADPTALEAFAHDYEAAFPLVRDEGSAFARAVGARSTPLVFLVRPAPEGSGPPVNAGMISDGVTVELFEAYQPFSRGMGAVLRMRLHPEDPFADFKGHQGDLVCSTCHQNEAMSWALTHHSVAYRTLAKQERHEDPACVSCHVTGMGEGGFVLGDHGSPFTDVTCESCHSAAGPHDGEEVDARSTCVGCHDAKHSVAFSVDKGLPHIDHFASTTMSEEAVRSRIEALSDGTADKPLLAFPDGPTVGSATCKGCHSEQHAWARGDRHAKAMKSLKKSEVESGCVACHATPKTMSSLAPPSPTDLSAWRTQEGVGCESCHGPGGAHAAAPSATNIVGLGESCPECVIEAICTSCHTEQWDPDWELKARLGAIDH